MIATIILPYTSKRSTLEDIEAIKTCLQRYQHPPHLLAFDYANPPEKLAESFPAKTITVTLNAYRPPAMSVFTVIPGPKFFARKRSKSGLLDDLLKDGRIRMPYSQKFSREMLFDESKFGPYTAIKTTAPNSSRGRGIHVFKSKTFEALRDPLFKMYKKDINAGYTPLLQQYINTGLRPTHTRVTTFLGAPIVCYRTSSETTLNLSNLSGMAGGEATSNFGKNRYRELFYDEEATAMSTAVCRAMPETSVLSIDMVRCIETGFLYCIEANLGNLCVLSASICSGLRKVLGKDAVRRQFGAYETIASRMVQTLDQIPD